MKDIKKAFRVKLRGLGNGWVSMLVRTQCTNICVFVCVGSFLPCVLPDCFLAANTRLPIAAFCRTSCCWQRKQLSFFPGFASVIQQSLRPGSRRGRITRLLTPPSFQTPDSQLSHPQSPKHFACPSVLDLSRPRQPCNLSTNQRCAVCMCAHLRKRLYVQPCSQQFASKDKRAWPDGRSQLSSASV